MLRAATTEMDELVEKIGEHVNIPVNFLHATHYIQFSSYRNNLSITTYVFTYVLIYVVHLICQLNVVLLAVWYSRSPNVQTTTP